MAEKEVDFKTADKLGACAGISENVADGISLAGFIWNEIKTKLQDLPEAAQVATLEIVLTQNTRHIFFAQQDKTGKIAEEPEEGTEREDDKEKAWKQMLSDGKTAEGDKCSDKQAKCLYAKGRANKQADLRIMEACEMWHLDDTRDMKFVQATILIDWLKKAGY